MRDRTVDGQLNGSTGSYVPAEVVRGPAENGVICEGVVRQAASFVLSPFRHETVSFASTFCTLAALARDVAFVITASEACGSTKTGSHAQVPWHLMDMVRNNHCDTTLRRGKDRPCQQTVVESE